MHALATVAITSPGWFALLALGLLGFAMQYQGTFDYAAALSVLNSQCFGQTLALVANSTLPAGALTGAQDVVLINTTGTPGNQTTRTAAQMFADLQQQLGFTPQPGYQWFLTIVHQGAGTLTLVAGAGVSLGTGLTSVATTGNRTYLCTLTAVGTAPAITIQTTGSGAA